MLIVNRLCEGADCPPDEEGGNLGRCSSRVRPDLGFWAASLQGLPLPICLSPFLGRAWFALLLLAERRRVVYSLARLERRWRLGWFGRLPIGYGRLCWMVMRKVSRLCL